jgi:hemoglobin
MKKDIENREDIDLLMQSFYSKAMTDELIGYIFTDVAKLDLEHHLPIIGDFWETLLFRTGDYARYGRNPLQIHGQLNRKTLLQPAHFRRWLKLFETSVDELFSGMRADFIKMRAEAIANRMQNFLSGVPAL